MMGLIYGKIHENLTIPEALTVTDAMTVEGDINEC